MKDYSMSVLEQYDIEVKGTRRTRGAILCDTDVGILRLEKANISKAKLPFLVQLTTSLTQCGFEKIDRMFFNKDGEFLTEAEDGALYILKKWFPGRECDVKKEREVLEAVRNLSRLHKMMRMPGFEWEETQDKKLGETMERHNRELRKIRVFIRNKTTKGVFERLVLEQFESVYEWAEQAERRLEQSSYEVLLKKSLEDDLLIHGDYNYHNLIMAPNGIATTNFEHFTRDIQVADLYYFMRKVLEKYSWNMELGRAMLRAYQETRKLTEEEQEYLAIRFSYPEKFWKIMNAYYCTNKAWISGKNVEKLSVSINQIEQKKRFLEGIFSFHL